MKRHIPTDVKRAGIADRAMYARAAHLPIVDEIQHGAPESGGIRKAGKRPARPHAIGFGVAVFASGERIDEKDISLNHWVAT